MAGCAVMILGIALMVWVGFWVFLTLFAAGVLITSWARIKIWLIQKGILNPIPGVQPGPLNGDVKLPPTIEGDYTRVDSE
ncbi:MAG: hypothetical protein ACOYNL_06010 [Rickettsiales bacterium]